MICISKTKTVHLSSKINSNSGAQHISLNNVFIKGNYSVLRVSTLHHCACLGNLPAGFAGYATWCKSWKPSWLLWRQASLDNPKLYFSFSTFSWSVTHLLKGFPVLHYQNKCSRFYFSLCWDFGYFSMLIHVMKYSLSWKQSAIFMDFKFTFLLQVWIPLCFVF